MTFAVPDAQSLPAHAGATLILRVTGVRHIRTTGPLPEPPYRPHGRGPDIIYRLKTRSRPLLLLKLRTKDSPVPCVISLPMKGLKDWSSGTVMTSETTTES